MRRSLLTPRRALVGVGILLSISSLLPVRALSWVANPAKNIVSAVLMPLQVPLNRVALTLRPAEVTQLDVQDPYHPGQDRAYIDQLEQEIARLRRENEALQQVREMLAVDRTVSAVTARVGPYSGDRLNPTLRIDRGSRYGIARGQAVVLGFALVGEVVNASPVNAEVRLFPAVESQLQVRLVPPASGEPPRRYQAWMQIRDRGQTLIIEADRNDPVEAGDWAHLADDRWPREAQGFVVAQVVDVRPDPNDPLRRKLVTLEPAVPLRSLRQVAVLVPGE